MFAVFGTKALSDPFVECQNTDMRFDDDAKLFLRALIVAISFLLD